MPTELQAVKQELRPENLTPMHLIEREAAAEGRVDVLMQLFDLKLRVEADGARKAFHAAMARFKENPPRIDKNKPVSFGTTTYKHATLDHVCDQIVPALSAVGIRHRWENTQDGTAISVTCILSHEMGHSESTTLTAMADASGSKNGIQAIASTVTYLQRYTLLGATGMAAVNADDDGMGGKGPSMSETEFIAMADSIANARNEEELGKVYRSAVAEALKVGDKQAVTSFMDKRAKRKGELA